MLFRSSLTFKQDIFRDPAGAERDPAGAERDPAGPGDAEPELLVTGRVRVACLDAAKFRPRALPDLILQELGIAGDLND